MYVINGFYMAMRDKYVLGKGIFYYVVAFDSEKVRRRREGGSGAN